MYDMIIVGGGPAGAITGKYLAKAGKKVLLLQKDFAFKKPCGGGIRMDAFDEFEIDAAVVEHLVTHITLETKKRAIAFDISKTPLGIVNRVIFDQKLRDDAMQAGVEVIEAKVTEVQRNVSSVSVHVQIAGESKQYDAAYLIAADGVFSVVRKILRQESVPTHLVHYSDIATLETQKCHFYLGHAFAKDGYGWRFPYQQGADVGTFSNKKGLSSLFKWLGITSKEKVKGYTIPKWEKPLFYEERVFYVGDAAGQVLPFTYEGIYYAMKSAKILSDVMIEGCDFEMYEQRWNSAYFKKFQTLKRLESIFLWNDFTLFLLMKTLEKPRIKEKVLALWMGTSELKLDMPFFIRVLKRAFLPKKT